MLEGSPIVLTPEQHRQMAAVYDGEQSNRETSEDVDEDQRLGRESHLRAIRDVAEHFNVEEEVAAALISWYGV